MGPDNNRTQVFKTTICMETNRHQARMGKGRAYTQISFHLNSDIQLSQPWRNMYKQTWMERNSTSQLNCAMVLEIDIAWRKACFFVTWTGQKSLNQTLHLKKQVDCIPKADSHRPHNPVNQQAIEICPQLTIQRTVRLTYFTFESPKPASNGSNIFLLTVSDDRNGVRDFSVFNNDVRTVRSLIAQSCSIEGSTFDVKWDSSSFCWSPETTAHKTSSRIISEEDVTIILSVARGQEALTFPIIEWRATPFQCHRSLFINFPI